MSELPALLQFFKFKVLSGLLMHLAKLSVRPGIFLFSGAHYSLQIKFKNAVKILAS